MFDVCAPCLKGDHDNCADWQCECSRRGDAHMRPREKVEIAGMSPKEAGYEPVVTASARAFEDGPSEDPDYDGGLGDGHWMRRGWW